MISNEEINNFLQEAESEMARIDKEFEQVQQATANLSKQDLDAANKQEIDSLLQEAKAKAQNEGRQRAAELESRLNINKPAVSMNTRRRGIANLV